MKTDVQIPTILNKLRLSYVEPKKVDHTQLIFSKYGSVRCVKKQHSETSNFLGVLQLVKCTKRTKWLTFSPFEISESYVYAEENI